MTTTRARRQRRYPRVAALAVASLTVLASCASPTDNDTRSATAGLPDTQQSLRASTWVLDGAASTPAIETDAVVTLSFGVKALEGQAPCNRYHAPYDVDEGDLTIGTIRISAMACDEPVMRAEDAYLQALGVVTSADTTDPDHLELTGPGDVSLAFDELDVAEAVAGTWDVVNLNTGDAITGPVAGTAPTLTFTTDGKLTADAGCNQIATGYEVDGHQITVHPARSTMKQCPEPEGVMDQEAALSAALERADRVDLTDQLTLLDDEGHILVTATRQGE